MLSATRTFGAAQGLKAGPIRNFVPGTVPELLCFAVAAVDEDGIHQ